MLRCHKLDVPGIGIKSCCILRWSGLVVISTALVWRIVISVCKWSLFHVIDLIIKTLNYAHVIKLLFKSKCYREVDIKWSDTERGNLSISPLSDLMLLNQSFLFIVNSSFLQTSYNNMSIEEILLNCSTDNLLIHPDTTWWVMLALKPSSIDIFLPVKLKSM